MVRAATVFPLLPASPLNVYTHARTFSREPSQVINWWWCILRWRVRSKATFYADKNPCSLRHPSRAFTGQCADGTIGDVVPSTDPRRDGSLPYGGSCKGTTKDATWDTVYPTIAHNLWQYYGATGVVEDHWDHLKLYLSYLEAQYYSTANETADRKPSFAKYFCRYRSQCGWKPCPAPSGYV